MQQDICIISKKPHLKKLPKFKGKHFHQIGKLAGSKKSIGPIGLKGLKQIVDPKTGMEGDAVQPIC